MAMDKVKKLKLLKQKVPNRFAEPGFLQLSEALLKFHLDFRT